MTIRSAPADRPLRKIARVIVLLFCASMLGALIGVHLVRARAASWLDQVGESLRRYAPEDGTATTSVQVNGMSFELSTRVARAGVDEVLAEAEADCRTLGSGFAEADTKNAQTMQLLRKLSGLDAILRTRGTTSGVVACLAPSDGPRTLSTFTEAARSFARELDPSVFGALHYLHASSTETGTLAVHVASRGPLPLRVAFPDDQDAPGTDPSDYPRPRRSLRLLSAAFDAHRASLHVYRMPQRSLEEATREYISAVRARGYDVHRHGNGSQASHVAVLSIHGVSRSAQVTLERVDDGVVLALAQIP